MYTDEVRVRSTRCQIRKRSCVLMLSKRGKGSVREGEAGKKAKTTPDAGVSKKYQGTRTS